MRCPFHVSVDMRIVERKPPRLRHRGPGDADAEQVTSIAVCPVDQCPYVAAVLGDHVIKLGKHIVDAVNAIR